MQCLREPFELSAPDAVVRAYAIHSELSPKLENVANLCWEVIETLKFGHVPNNKFTPVSREDQADELKDALAQVGGEKSYGQRADIVREPFPTMARTCNRDNPFASFSRAAVAIAQEIWKRHGGNPNRALMA